MEIFAYDFMQKAFLAGITLAVIIPCIGVIIVLRRLPMIGDALAHTSLAGVAAGLLLGINPVAGAIVVSMAAALCIEGIRKKLPKYAELSIAVTMSAGIGLAGILSGFTSGSGSFNSFLFGSIVSIDSFELALVIATSLVVLIVFLLLYKELFYVALDESSARISGVPVGFVNAVFTLLTAACVSIASRTVGALIVSSLMVIPVTCAMQFAKSYRQTVIFSVLFAVCFTIAGLFLSFYLDLRPGATIVLTGCVVLIAILITRNSKRKLG
ncbi:MAG: metal ABC transporter permease [Oscillospiraceae bacterium]|nr:metal ABC transporter permease [Oscillospiraceae bacterium]